MSSSTAVDFEDDDALFTSVYGMPPLAYYIFTGFYAAIALAHIVRCFMTKAWAHGLFALAFLLQVAAYIMVTQWLSLPIFIVVSISTMCMAGTLSWLLAEWTQSMRSVMRTTAVVGNTLAYLVFIVIIMRTAGSIISILIQLLRGRMVSTAVNIVLYYTVVSALGLLWLASLAMLALCPAESTVEGSALKRWQIAFLSFNVFLYTLGWVLDILNVAYASSVLLVLQGLVALYPMYTCCGLAVPPKGAPASQFYANTTTPQYATVPVVIMPMAGSAMPGHVHPGVQYTAPVAVNTAPPPNIGVYHYQAPPNPNPAMIYNAVPTAASASQSRPYPTGLVRPQHRQ